MPYITVPGYGRVPATEGQHAAPALAGGGVPVVHRCGDAIRCTLRRSGALSDDAGPVLPGEVAALQSVQMPGGVRLTRRVPGRGKPAAPSLISVGRDPAPGRQADERPGRPGTAPAL